MDIFVTQKTAVNRMIFHPVETLLVVNYVVNYENCYSCNICFLIYSSDKTSDLFELVFHPADEHGQRKYVLSICEHVMKPMNV